MKRMNIMLLLILAAAVGLFGGYQFWIHNNLDTTGPVITIDDGLLEVSVKDPQEALLVGLQAMDDRDGDVTAGVLIESIYGINENRETTVTYAAFDAAGNVSKAQRQVRYRDYVPPRFQLYGSLTFLQGGDGDLMETVGAWDQLEGDIRRRIHATLISDTKSLDNRGVHQVRLQVTNSLGDMAQIVVPVEVYDPQWYTAQVTLTDYMVYLKQGAWFEPKTYLDTFSVRGEAVDVSKVIPAEISLEIDNKVRMDTPGVYEVTYILSQTVGMDTHSGIAKLIVIVE